MKKFRLGINMDPVNDGVFETEVDKTEWNHAGNEHEDYVAVLVTSKGDFKELSDAEYKEHVSNIRQKGVYACMKIPGGVEFEFDYRHVLKEGDEKVFVGTALMKIFKSPETTRDDIMFKLMEAITYILVPVRIGNDLVSGFGVNDAETF